MRGIITISLLLLVFSLSFAATVLKEAPREVVEGETFKVILNIKTETDKFDLAEFIPPNLEIQEWKVTPNLEVSFESSDQKFLGNNYIMNHWKFESTSESIKLEYKIKVKESGEYKFITLWISPKGFDLFHNNLNVVKKTQTKITGLTILPSKEVEEEKEIQTKNTEKIEELVFKINDLIFSLNY